MKIGVRITKLLDGQANVDNVDVMSHNIAVMLSTLEWAIVESPEEFVLREVGSYADLFRIYMGYLNYQHTFRGVAGSEPKKDGTGVQPNS